MTAYVALLRAVNVSGTGKLPMAELRRMGEACGFSAVRTHIASGNLLLDSDLPEAEIVARLEQQLDGFFGRRVPLFVRSAAEICAIADSNPFPDEPGNRNLVIFLADPPPPDFMAAVRFHNGERIAPGTREISVAYGDGIATSKLVIPAAKAGTARNRNTVARLAALLEEHA